MTEKNERGKQLKIIRVYIITFLNQMKEQSLYKLLNIKRILDYILLNIEMKRLDPRLDFFNKQIIQKLLITY